VMHLDAQVEAVLYSWRMVRQCVGVFMALHEADERRPVPAVVERMSKLLAELPSIPRLLDASLGPVDDTAVGNALGMLYKMLGVQEDQEERDRTPTDPAWESRTKKRKRKKDISQSKNAANNNTITPSSNNMFDLLAIEE